MREYDIHTDNLPVSKESDADIHSIDFTSNHKKYEALPITKPVFSQLIEHGQRRGNLQSCLL